MTRRSLSAYRPYRDRYTKRTLAPGRDAITCRLCGEKLRFMGTHLVRRHGITAAEYRERFPNAPTVSPSTSAMYSDVLIDIAGTEVPAVGINAERQLGIGWTPETCITALKEFNRLHRRPPTYSAPSIPRSAPLVCLPGVAVRVRSHGVSGARTATR